MLLKSHFFKVTFLLGNARVFIDKFEKETEFLPHTLIFQTINSARLVSSLLYHRFTPSGGKDILGNLSLCQELGSFLIKYCFSP